MTKAIPSPLDGYSYGPSSKNFFSENEVLRWLAASLGTVSGFFTLDLFRRKNKILNETEKSQKNNESRIKRIEHVIFYKDSNGKATNLAATTREIKHTLANMDKGEAGALSVILLEFQDIKEELKGLKKRDGG